MKTIKKLLTILLSLTLMLSFSSCTSEKELQEKYKEGYSIGYEEGYDEGDNDGYHRGYDYGYEDGYEKGYDDAEIEIQNSSYDDNDSNSSYTVYITEYGSKYHRSGCGSLWDSCYSISYDDAINSGYTPCERCNP